MLSFLMFYHELQILCMIIRRDNNFKLLFLKIVIYFIFPFLPKYIKKYFYSVYLCMK